MLRGEEEVLRVAGENVILILERHIGSSVGQEGEEWKDVESKRNIDFLVL